MKKAPKTGIMGYDGSYLPEFLFDKGYTVHGTVRRVAFEDPVHRVWCFCPILDELHLHSASLESAPASFVQLSK